MRDALLDDHARHYATVARAIAYIRANAYRQPALSEIATAVSLSEHHLQRVFSEWAGVSPKRFLQYVTKEHARRALRESSEKEHMERSECDDPRVAVGAGGFVGVRT